MLKWYIGQLFLFARDILDGEANIYANCSAERKALVNFKEKYGEKKKSLRITDIGFEDYYLIHDLLCHKMVVGNPEQFVIREAMRMAYLHAIYNNGHLNLLHKKYSKSLVAYLQGFDNIFTTNYDSNIESCSGKEVYHIHGQFDKLSEVYNPSSFRNQLSDNPLDGIAYDEKYNYLHSTALSTYCGEYKQFHLNQYTLANEGIEKMAKGYVENEFERKDVDSWKDERNKLIVNMAEAIKLKVENPELRFQEDYHIDEFKSITGELSILGLSPYNDYHIFEIIDNSDLEKCIYFYYDEAECSIIKKLLPNLRTDKKLVFRDVKEFWRNLK